MSDENDDYEFEVVDEYDDSDVSQTMTSVDTGAKIGDSKSVYAYIGPENIRDPEGKLKVIIPNVYNDIPDQVATEALENIVYSQRYNPFLLDFRKIQKTNNEEKYKEFDIPDNISELFLMCDEKIERPGDVSNLIDPNKMPELYGTVDHHTRFGRLDLSDERDVNLVLNRDNIIPYLLIKLYLKDKTVMFRLMTDVKFGIINDKEYGKSIAPISYTSFIEFKPIKIKKNKRSKK